LTPSAKSSFVTRPALPDYCSADDILFEKRNGFMPIGKVKFFNNEKGFGFIVPEEGGQDSFVHISAVERAGFTTLRENQRLSYEVENDKRGRPSAVNLEAAD
jgi:CspA family cold shock protein